MRLDCTGASPRIDTTDGAFPLTEAQQQAMVYDREVAVLAGAGAGKTATLSLRYVGLLLELAHQAAIDTSRPPQADIAAVLVLTFTDKAAQEMKERCHQRLTDLVDQVQPDGSQRGVLEGAYGSRYTQRLVAALLGLADRFEQAQISTFHAFCGRILREFPLIAGISPDVALLDDLEIKALRRRVTQEVIEAAYASEEQGVRDLVHHAGGHRAAMEALAAAIDNRTAYQPFLAEVPQWTLRDLWNLAPVSEAWVERWVSETGRPTLETIVEIMAPAQAGKWAQLDQAARRLDSASPVEAMRTIIACLMKPEGTPRSLVHHSFIGSKSSWNAAKPAAYSEAKERLGELKEHLSTWEEAAVIAGSLPGPASSGMLDALKGLSALALEAGSRIDAWMAENNAIDFDHLQSRGVAIVLENPEVLSTLQRRIRYLMVDEFQDTDPSQWAMVKAIGRPPEEARDRIFVVGDAKQAIYSFRGGDVSVFNQAVRELDGDPVIFPDNFRSRTGLIDWFNAFFGDLLGRPDADRPDYEASYTSLRAGRGQPGGTVRFITYPNENAAENARTEARAIASILKHELEPRTGPYADVPPSRPGEPAAAILLGTRTHLPAYEAAMREYGVDYVVAKGVGFWTRPEVMDAVNIFDAIVRGDAVSTVGALRSPWFGLSDQDIQDLRENQPANAPSIFSNLEDLVTSPTARIARAAVLFQDLRTSSRTQPPSALLRAIVDRTDAVHALALQPDGAQAVANLEQLIAVSHRLDHLGGFEVAKWLIDQVMEPPAQGEATIPPTTAEVVLMTIHASKGLEFPVVVVPRACAAQRSNRDRVVTGQVNQRPMMAMKALDPVSEFRERTSPGLMTQLKHQRALESAAEWKRLLYVAATRARDHLIFLGKEPSMKGAPKTWIQFLRAYHSDRVHELPGVSWEEIARKAPPPPTVRKVESEAIPPTLAPVIPSRPALSLSPSSLDRLMLDPTEAWRRTARGLPEGARPTEKELRRQAAGLRGEAIHTLLEDDLLHDEAAVLARWHALARRALLPESIITQGATTLLDHVARVAADPRVMDRQTANHASEVRFKLDIKHVTLSGSIDRLWQDANGQWVVLDWKSERIVGDAIAAARRHARQLITYVWAANQILGAQGQPLVTRAEIYFTATGHLVELGPIGATELNGLLHEIEFAGDWAMDPQASPPERGLDVDALPMRLIPSSTVSGQITLF